MYLQVKVIPKSRQTEFVERMEDDTLKIRLKEAPERGAANDALIRFLSKSILVPKEEIRIISGHSDRRKLIKLPDNTHLPW